MQAITISTPPHPLRLETARTLVTLIQELDGPRRDAVIDATKAYLRDRIHKERYKASRKARGLPVYGYPPFTTPPAVAEALGLEEKKETE
jgi:hypothetical protein